MLSEEQIIEFQQIYLKVFGKKINKEEALNKGVKLIVLLSTIYQKLGK